MEINVHEGELCVKLVIYKDCNEMHGQQNIKFCVLPFLYMTEALAAFILGEKGTGGLKH
jgi:hypothetical protein